MKSNARGSWPLLLEINSDLHFKDIWGLGLQLQVTPDLVPNIERQISLPLRETERFSHRPLGFRRPGMATKFNQNRPRDGFNERPCRPLAIFEATLIRTVSLN